MSLLRQIDLVKIEYDKPNGRTGTGLSSLRHEIMLWADGFLPTEQRVASVTSQSRELGPSLRKSIADGLRRGKRSPPPEDFQALDEALATLYEWWMPLKGIPDAHSGGRLDYAIWVPQPEIRTLLDDRRNYRIVVGLFAPETKPQPLSRFREFAKWIGFHSYRGRGLQRGEYNRVLKTMLISFQAEYGQRCESAAELIENVSRGLGYSRPLIYEPEKPKLLYRPILGAGGDQLRV